MKRRAVLAAMALLWLAGAGRPLGQSPAQVRVPDRQDYTNAHMGPTSAQPVIVLIPAGTVLPVVKKQGEWFQVKLAPELRKLGMRMRWYKNETEGWVHESTVEPATARPQSSKGPA